MTAIAAAGYISNNARTEGEAKQFLEDLRSILAELAGGPAAEQALTLATDIATPASGASRMIVLDTEAAAATDNLATIAQTNVPDGALIGIRNANAARTIVVKHLAGGTGQISLRAGADALLSDTATTLWLRRNGTQFNEVRAFPDRAAVQSKSSNFSIDQSYHDQIVRATASLTLTLPAASAVGNGFFCVLEVASGFVLTFSGTVSGIAGAKIAGGGAVLLFCDGTNYRVEFIEHSRERIDVGDGSTVDLRELVVGSRYARLVTSTTTITAFTMDQGAEYDVLFNTVRQITYNATSLILPGAANIPATTAGDWMRLLAETGSNGRVVNYVYAAATPNNTDVMRTIASGTLGLAGDNTINIPSGTWKEIEIEFIDLEAATDFLPFLRFNSDTGSNYQYVNSYDRNGAGGNTASASAASGISIGINSQLWDDNGTTQNPVSFKVRIANPAGSSKHKNVEIMPFMVRNSAALFDKYNTAARWLSAAAITAVNLLLRGTTGASPTGSTINLAGGSYVIRGEL